MSSREEHLKWCKARALAELDGLGTIGIQPAMASMLSDLNKWDGGEMYEPAVLLTLMSDAIAYRTDPAKMRDWINGFS